MGNLVEAKKHLALAERMLELETPPQMDAATESSLDVNKLPDPFFFLQTYSNERKFYKCNSF